jgi:hypothetical protein
MTDLAALRALAEKATPGPWDWEYGVSQRTAWALMQPGGQWTDDRYVLRFEGPQDISLVPNPEADMDFIAAFDPTTAAALLSEVESLRRVRDAAATVLADTRHGTFGNVQPPHTSPGRECEACRATRAYRLGQLEAALAATEPAERETAR